MIFEHLRSSTTVLRLLGFARTPPDLPHRIRYDPASLCGLRRRAPRLVAREWLSEESAASTRPDDLIA